MISLRTTVKGSDAVLKALVFSLQDPSARKAMYGKVATDLKAVVKKYVADTPGHATAERLGAKPTGHFSKLAGKIEEDATENEAILRIPRKGRIRAAFGSFDILPTGGRKYLAIPTAAESYGKMPSSFPKDQLQFLRVGPKQTPILAKKAVRAKKGQPLVVLYLLVKKVHVNEDRTLFPFQILPEVAADSATRWLVKIIKQNSTPLA